VWLGASARLKEGAQVTKSAMTEVGSSRGTGWILTIAGVAGFLAAVILTNEKIGLLQGRLDGTFKPLSCDLNAFVSCSAVMESEQAQILGVTNSIIGVAAFAVVMTLGVLSLAHVEFPTFVWIGMQIGVLLAACVVTWLQVESIYVIGKLCPWCVVVWATVIPLTVIVTARNFWAWKPTWRVSRLMNDWTALIIAVWYVAILSAIWFGFGSDLWA